jgi:ribosomal-protein-alanine N-acetyltransferase
VNRQRKLCLTAGRVCLRGVEKKDCDEFIRLIRKSGGLHRGLVSPPKERRQFLAWVRRGGEADAARFLLCRVGDGTIVGAINVGHIIRENLNSAYLGYYIGAPFARQGYMTEALQLALRFGFNGLRLNRLEANIQPRNLASKSLVRRAGFVREGISRRYLKVCGRWRDHERWAILAEDWRRRQR